MNATVMSCRSNKHGVALAASLLLSRLVWLFKPDIEFARKAKIMSDEFGGPKSRGTVPAKKREEITKKYSAKMAKAVEVILGRGYWSPSMRHMNNPPTDGRKKWVLRRHYFKRVALFTYSWMTDSFGLSVPDDERIAGYPWWDTHRLKDVENGKLGTVTAAQREYTAFVKNTMTILGSTHEPDNRTDPVSAGTSLFEVNEHTEFDPTWVRGQEKYRVSLVDLKVPVPRMALALPETAKFLCFKCTDDLGPVMLDTERITPSVDWTIPEKVQEGDPWIFYGEPLK